MKKKFLKNLSLLCLLGSVIGLVSCNGDDPINSSVEASSEPTSVVTPEPSSTIEPESSEAPSTIAPTSEATETSPIKSLTAVQDKVVMRIDEKTSAESYYELIGYGALNNKTKKVTVTSSNEDVVKYKSKKLVASGLGEATITVTSDADTTKTCTFDVEVKDVFFDRNYSGFLAGDDTSKELPSEGGVIEIAPDAKTYTQGDYIIKGINSTTWMAEVTIEVKSVLYSEHYPKFGIFACSTSEAAEGTNNQVNFFLDGWIGEGTPNYQWTNFGVCEVSNGGGWAWNTGVSNADARHADGAYQLSDSYITCQSYKDSNPEATGVTSFKMKLARDGFVFHLWVNDNYAFSMEVLHYLFSDSDGQPCKAMPGFFQFNSGVVFSNYSVTDDQETVQAAIASIEGGANILTNDQYADD